MDHLQKRQLSAINLSETLVFFFGGGSIYIYICPHVHKYNVLRALLPLEAGLININSEISPRSITASSPWKPMQP